ncbi:MAG: lipase maturation factor family protein [Polyangiales bacterium]
MSASNIPAPAAAKTYDLAARLFLRALGGVLLLAFVSANAQLDGLIGDAGLFPAAFWLDDLRAQGAGFWSAPSLAWLSATNGALHSIAYLGVAGSLLLMAGRLCIPALVTCFVSYLSIVNIGASFFAYQWDALLLETCVVAIPLATLSAKKGRDVPAPALARYALYFLNFRLVFCSGVVKLGGATWRDLSALQFHYWTQPLPGPLSWYVHQLPDSFHSACVASALAAELVLPCLLFVPRARRHAAVGLVALQGAFLVTGNFGFFNLLAMSLCLPAIDDAFWRRRLPTRLQPSDADEPPSASVLHQRWRQGMAAALMVFALIPTFGTLVGWSRMPASVGNFYVALQPLRLVSGYGLFARMTTERVEFIFEGTADGTRWQRYEFSAKPDSPDELPSQSAPHLPRLDWGLWFAALGHPAYAPLVDELHAALERAEPDVLALLASDPFDGERPRAVRVRRVRQRFSTWSAHDERGVYWEQEEVVRSPR